MIWGSAVVRKAVVEFCDAGRAIFAELLCCGSGLCEVGFPREDSYLLGLKRRVDYWIFSNVSKDRNDPDVRVSTPRRVDCLTEEEGSMSLRNVGFFRVTHSKNGMVKVFGRLALDDGTDMLSRNVGSQLAASARNIPDERLYRLNCCGSLEFRNGKFNKTLLQRRADPSSRGVLFSLIRCSNNPIHLQRVVRKKTECERKDWLQTNSIINDYRPTKCTF